MPKTLDILRGRQPAWTLWISLLASVLIAFAAWESVVTGGGLTEKLGRLLLYLSPLPIVLSLVRRFPADHDQPLLGPWLLQDSAYFVVIIAFRIAFTALFITAIADSFDRHLGYLRLEIGQDWPLWLRVTSAFLLSDFLAWFHHLVRHKVKIFWEFHKIHHSQHQMNYFTDFRIHPVDYVIANLIVIVPQLLLQVGAPTIVLIGVLVQWHTMIYHSNLRTNYGPLRYILVTPQSHRVHHSRQIAHHDHNFGVVLSIWDRLFRTQYAGTDEYPRTGVEPQFPTECSYGEVLKLRALWRQFLYPFQKLLRGWS